MPKNKRNKKNNRRTTQPQPIAFPKVDYAQVAKEQKNRKIQRIKESQEAGETTKEILFKGDAREMLAIADSHGYPKYRGAKSYEISCFHEHERIFCGLYQECGMPGLLTNGFLEKGNLGVYTPFNHYIYSDVPELINLNRGGRPMTADRMLALVDDLAQLGYAVSVSIIVDIEDEYVHCLLFDAGDVKRIYDYHNHDAWAVFNDHVRHAAFCDIEISPIDRLSEVVKNAIAIHNRLKPNNYVHNPRQLSFDRLKKLVMNYLRHECSNYDEAWNACEDRIQVVHEIFRKRFNDAVEEVYPEMDEFLRGYLKPSLKSVPKPVLKSTSRAA